MRNETERAEYKRQWAKRNPEKVRASKARHRANNPDSVARHMRAWSLKTHFGITPQDYEKMFESQQGRCAVCDQQETAERDGKLVALAVDHDHKTGSIRGLLCSKCNCALGLVGDNAERLRSMIAYIERNN